MRPTTPQWCECGWVHTTCCVPTTVVARGETEVTIDHVRWRCDRYPPRGGTAQGRTQVADGGPEPLHHRAQSSCGAELGARRREAREARSRAVDACAARSGANKHTECYYPPRRYGTELGCARGRKGELAGPWSRCGRWTCGPEWGDPVEAAADGRCAGRTALHRVAEVVAASEVYRGVVRHVG